MGAARGRAPSAPPLEQVEQPPPTAQPALPAAAEVFEREEHAPKADKIAKSILEAGSLRISELSQVMPGTSLEANYNAIQRRLRWPRVSNWMRSPGFSGR